MTVEWELDGQRFVGINGGRLPLGAAHRRRRGGPCGWLEDRYEVWGQVVPVGMRAMFGMRKLDVAELRRAADGVAAG